MKKAKLKWLVEQSNAGEVIDKSHWGSGSELLYTCAKDPLISDFPDFPEKKRTRPSDLLLTRNGTPYIHKPETGSIYSNVVQRISVLAIDRDFLHYALQSRVASFRGYGVSIESLNYEMWGNLDIWTTGRSRQASIACFLDRETGQIDGLIEIKTRFIALLKEKRVAVITHAVTKGIDPNAPLKDSGEAWIGQIPEHWEVKPLRAFFNFRNEKNDPVKTENILSLSIAQGVTLYNEEGRGGNKSKEDLTAYKIAHEGDIVLNSMNVIVGAVGRSKYFGAISPVYYALFPKNDDVYVPFFEKIFMNSGFQKGLLRFGKGILMKISGTGQMNTIRMKISQDDLKVVRFPVPPHDEQVEIARQIEYEVSRIDNLIALTERSIELLREKRAALITAAVTGKIDVRAA